MVEIDRVKNLAKHHKKLAIISQMDPIAWSFKNGIGTF